MRWSGGILLSAMVLAGCEETALTGTIPAAPPAVAVGQAPATEGQLLGVLQSTGAAGLFRQAGRNGDVTRWRARDGSGFDLRSGIVIATYAIGHDLAAADPGETLNRLGSGVSGEATRVHRYIDGENRTVTRAFMCDVRLGPTRRGTAGQGSLRDATETCFGSGTEFTNRYLVSTSGRVLSSVQWVGPDEGYLRIGPAQSPGPAIVPIAVRN